MISLWATKVSLMARCPLLKKGNNLQEVFGDVKDIHIDSPPEIFNHHKLYEKTVQVDEDLRFDVDGCVLDNPKRRLNPNIYLTLCLPQRCSLVYQ